MLRETEVAPVGRAKSNVMPELAYGRDCISLAAIELLKLLPTIENANCAFLPTRFGGDVPIAVTLPFPKLGDKLLYPEVATP